MGDDLRDQETTMPGSPSSVMASICDRFEEAWKGGEPPSIDDFLITGDSEPEPKRDLLCALVDIDMEKRWRLSTARDEASKSTLDAKTSSFPWRPRLSDYVDRYPTLGPVDELPVDLICQEYYVRKLHEDQPDPDDYLKRWGHRYPDLPERLAEVDQSLVAVRGQEAEEQLPERIAGRFLVKKLLGKGAFGSVYLAFDERLQRLVAVKVPRRERVASREDIEAYLSEARALAALRHANIVTVHDADKTEDGVCFVVSEFIEGSDLKEQIAEERPSHAESVELVATIAEALHHAHSRGIVHRDIKPANILIEHTGKPYVVDFGLALRDEDFGKDPGVAGTPAYMSPEQARGESHLVDGRSDIFSLGAVFYELLSGVQPFRHDDWQKVLNQVIGLDPRPPRQIHNSIPVELERICLKALSKRASDRYATAGDMATDLRHFQRDHKPADRPKGPAKIIPKGLRSFDEHDADFFLELLPGARDRDGLPESLRFWKTRIEETDPDKTFRAGLIYGPSGCGKSSFVKAGLLPRVSDDVTVVFVEATADQTETRLMRGLRKRCLDLPAEGSLKEQIATLRRGRAIPAGRKVLIVLDQFEQWLHANREEEDTELAQSLRQCDGGRVQCLVTVRDDFWMSATRFFQQLEVRLAEGENSAAVDLFDQSHAKKVLTSFGGAFERLPEESQESAPDQSLFVDEAVSGLAIEGKIICVRLALFAEMMKGKPWTPETLRSVGGTEGLGVTFLEETFSAATAPPEHRLHQTAARGVLKALLPEQSTEIKGSMCSSDELREASGYAGRAKDFGELLEILDGELRLVTPTDPEGIEAEEDGNRTFGAGLPTSPKPPTEGLPASPPGRPEVSDSGESVGKEGDLRSDASAGPETRAQQSSARRGAHDLAEAPDRRSPQAEQASSSSSSLRAPASSLCYYQLTHDYLVPSLRQWLTRRQQETRRGRAELRLTERASLWNAKLENRHLPSVREWASIRLLTRKRDWTEPQASMMGKAGRVHLARVAMLLVTLGLLSWCGYEINGYFQAKSLVETLLSAKEETVPNVIGELQPYRRWARSRLEQQLVMEPKTPQDERRQLHARLALLAEDNRHVAQIKDALLSADISYVGVLRDSLLPYSSDLIDYFRRDLQNAELPVEYRFRAGLSLAAYDPVGENWNEEDRRFLAEQLVAANPEHQARLREYLRPISNQLLVELERLFTDPSLPESQQLGTANALTDFAGDDGPRLSHLISEATPAQFKIVYPKLAKSGSARDVLRQLAARQPAENLPGEERVTLGKRRAGAAITLLRQGAREESFAALRVREDPESLTQFVHRCRAREVQPLDLLECLDAADTLRQTKTGADRLLEDRVMFGLLLALGEYSFEELPAARREPLVGRLTTWYSGDPSSAIHGATGWLLRHWNHSDKARKVDQTPVPYAPDREWYTLAIPIRATDASDTKTEAERDSVFFTFVVFPPGEYQIGSPADEPDRDWDETRHKVRITRPFAVCDREITWAQFSAFDGGSHRKSWENQFERKLSGDDPVFGVSWFEAVGYCRWLTEQRGISESSQCYDSRPLEADLDYRAGWVLLSDSTDWPLRLDGLGFRLLTEAEWETMCRAGTETRYSFGNDDGLLKHYAWFADNSNKWSHVIARLRPNLRGMLDTHGNLYEWCHDWHSDDYYESPSADDPSGPTGGSYRVVRGGSWAGVAGHCRSASRNCLRPLRSPSLGFRVALVAVDASGK